MIPRRLLDKIEIADQGEKKSVRYSISLTDETGEYDHNSLKKGLVRTIRKEFSVMSRCGNRECDSFDDDQPCNCMSYQGIDCCDESYEEESEVCTTKELTVVTKTTKKESE